MATAAIFGTSVSVVEVVPQQLSYVVMLPRRVDGVQQYPPLPSDTAAACYSALEEFCVYYPFFLDMGPVSLCRLYRFCGHLNALLAAQPRRHVYLVSGAHMQRRANSVYLIAAHGLLYRGLAAVEALAPFKGLSPPLAAWHDASPQADPFHLTTLDVLRGIARARASGFFSFSCFDLARFERYEAAENGDLNWLAEGRFLALAGPQDPQPGAPASEEGYSVTSVEQLLPVLKQFGVGALVRLNRKYYNERKVVAAGIAHADLYFEDGSNPPEHILQKFLKFCEGTQGAIGVHCKAGLGRTGTCIGAYFMKHYNFTAREAIGWMRVCRPGSVIGPQQDFLESIQTRMWDEGHRFRAAHRLPPPLKGSVMAQFAAAQAAAEAEAAAAAASEPAAGSSSSSAASSAAAAYVSGSNPSSYSSSSSSSSSRDHSALLLRRKLLVGSGSSSSGSLGALREASGLRGSLSGGGAGSAGSSGSTWEQLEREAGASSAALSAALSSLYPAGSSRGRGAAAAAAAAAAGGGGGEGASSYARLAGLGGQYAGSAPHRVTAAAGAAALLSTPATAGPGPSSPGREMSQGDLLRLAKEKARSPTGAGRH